MTTNQEKVEMIKTLKPGDKISFSYIKRVPNYERFPAETSYEVEDRMGKVIEVRDTYAEPISRLAISRNLATERSQYLVTVQLNDGKIKSFYSGRIANPKKISKGFLMRVLDKMAGR